MNQRAAMPAVPEPRGSALDADGYVVVPTGLPPSILEAVVDDIWRHAGATPGDPATWYQPAIIRPRPGMVEMYHYQSMWDVRQHPAVYRDFPRPAPHGRIVGLHRPGRAQAAGPARPARLRPAWLHPLGHRHQQVPGYPIPAARSSRARGHVRRHGRLPMRPLHLPRPAALPRRTVQGWPGPPCSRHRRPSDRQGSAGRGRPGYLEDDALARKRQELRSAPPAGPVPLYEPAAPGRRAARDAAAKPHQVVVCLRATRRRCLSR